ncbi:MULTISPECIES: hypothetical protein [unclassified Pseudomonas]|uniref:hypothetical protein n=1 Tax=unclassified Pseudomonas TaxID=196821 RepID=UPI000C87B91E|nr:MULTISPECIES: hypothetical protein [unclassified Pseudomonas]PMU07806.1 hypothetical protein C1Y11_25505 [Pseudomonas sp. FW305-20]PMU18350.1 hypothetical protein C1Y10_13585 [Pseudomonas sp. FW305-122]PMU39600.1 hypothetical protein C1Y12_12910 [Pseudomonas sp. FW305-47B]PMX57139.1 hypothetical protein C1Y13_25310 [Pseudomonas sp. FW305-33]PMX62628.1 hypothetical protein C1X12_23710 [Pseudomonas sp. FW305-60]
MTTNKLVSRIHAVHDWCSGKGLALGHLHRSGTRPWKRKAIILLSILLALAMAYLATFQFASRAMQDLISTCTARFEIELENAGIESLTNTLLRSLCECLAHKLLDKNGMVRLALVDRHRLDPLALEPVTEEDGSDCINAL